MEKDKIKIKNTRKMFRLNDIYGCIFPLGKSQ